MKIEHMLVCQLCGKEVTEFPDYHLKSVHNVQANEQARISEANPFIKVIHKAVD